MSEWAGHPFFLVPAGLFIGFLGTLVGVGGGFLMVPLFTLLLGMPHEWAIGTSLTIVFFNALSGSFVYARQGRIDLQTGLVFAVATVPLTFVGWMMAHRVPFSTFRAVFALLLVLCVCLLTVERVPPSSVCRWFRRGYGREFVDAMGERYRYEINLWMGVFISLGVGFLSSFFGVGGGFIHVPLMILFFGIPVHVATATSQFILAITAGVGAGQYAFRGEIEKDVVLFMGLGVVGGAAAGAWLAPRFRALWIRRILALVLFFVAARMLWAAGFLNFGGRP